MHATTIVLHASYVGAQKVLDRAARGFLSEARGDARSEAHAGDDQRRTPILRRAQRGRHQRRAAHSTRCSRRRGSGKLPTSVRPPRARRARARVLRRVQQHRATVISPSGAVEDRVVNIATGPEQFDVERLERVEILV